MNLDRFKFRVARFENDKFDCFLDSENLCIYSDGTLHNKGQFNFELSQDDNQCIFFKILQCTGLRDENNKLIYEGDLIRDTIILDDGTKEKVKNNFTQIAFRDAQFCFVANAGTKEEYQYAMMYEDDEKWDVSFDIVGNIYENPELSDFIFNKL